MNLDTPHDFLTAVRSASTTISLDTVTSNKHQRQHTNPCLSMQAYSKAKKCLYFK